MRQGKNLKRIITLVILCFIMTEMSILTQASEICYVTNKKDVVLFEGTMEECQTYSNYIVYYDECGKAWNPDGTVFRLSYNYGNTVDVIRFDFERMKMTWIDGSEWNITYTGSLDYDYLSCGLFKFTDDAIRAFCPEFALTHSLIPEGVPENFETVLNKARVQYDARNGIVRETSVEVQTEVVNDVIETYEAFNELDYAERYPDVKAAFGIDKQLLWNHYQMFGKNEGRIALFNE